MSPLEVGKSREKSPRAEDVGFGDIFLVPDQSICVVCQCMQDIQKVRCSMHT